MKNVFSLANAGILRYLFWNKRIMQRLKLLKWQLQPFVYNTFADICG